MLTWPYEDLPVMDPSTPFDFRALKPMVFEYNSQSTERRKLFNHEKSLASLASGIGLYKSTTDRSKGHAAESLLVKKLEAQGLECYELEHVKDNYIRHIDIEVSDPTKPKCFTVDIEAPKALRKSRAGYTDPLSQPQDRFVCLQLGPSSTLFGGHADYMAFGLTTGHYVFAKRQAIVNFLKHKMASFVDGSTAYRSAWPETALWVPYIRSYEGHHTIMTYMDLNELPLEGYV